MSDPIELRALEQKWAAEVKQSKLRLEFCRFYVKQMHSLAVDAPAPEGGYAYRNALKSERLALAEYSRKLRIYSDLIVYRKVPREERP